MIKEIGNEGLDRGYDPVPVLKALAHPLRFSLFELLAGGEKCVCDLVDVVDASQPLVSHHLSVLKKAGLVRDRHDATWVYYSAAPEGWEAFRDALNGIRPTAATATPCPPEDGSS